MELVPIVFKKIMQSRSYTVIILGTDQKKFAIYMEPHVGQLLQMHLSNESGPRPYTHDLLNSVFKGLSIKPLQIVINDLEDTIYFARLFLEQQTDSEKKILEIDARPSDCFTLAVMNNIPLFCRKEIFEQAVAVED